MSGGSHGPTGIGLVLVPVVMLVATACVAWPLATYTLSLAAFGLAHVVAELRYVDRRFGRRLGQALARRLVIGLVGIALVRAAWLTGGLAHAHAIVVELALGLGLVALVLPKLVRGRPWAGVVGGLLAGVIAIAIVAAPAAGLLALAGLHNLTPVGFVLEASSGPARRHAAWWCAVVFFVVPLVIATGVGWALVQPLAIAAPEVSPLGYGPLHEAMRAYLPVESLPPATALHLFCACVFLQCAHYGAVLLVMPRRLPPHAEGRLRWPGPRWWPLVLGATALALVPFAIDFAQARAGYGVLATVHAWVELPILLLALLGAQPRSHKP